MKPIAHVPNNRRIPVVSVLLFVAVAALGAAQTPSMGESGLSRPTITVVGTGSRETADLVGTVQLSIESIDSDPQEAVRDNSEAMNRLIRQLEQAGIPDGSIRTTGFYMFRDVQSPGAQSIQSSGRSRSQEPIVRFRVRNSVTVHVTSPEQVAEVVDLGVRAGATDVSNNQFSPANPANLYDQALEDALAAARARARHLAESQGMSIGGILRIQEITSPGGVAPLSIYGRGGESGPPVQPGNRSVQASVRVTFELIQG